LVKNIVTVFPCATAAPPTKNATVTRSASSNPVARLITTLLPPAILYLLLLKAFTVVPRAPNFSALRRVSSNAERA
jgi:hypothetical protein